MAVTAYRTLGYVGFAKQTALGSGAAPTKFLKNVKSTFMAKPTVNDYSNGNVVDIGFSLKEKFHYGGQLQCFVYASEAAAIFAHVMGLDTISGAGPYTHTITLTNGISLLSLEASFFENQILDRVLDSKIDKVLLEAEAGKPLMLTIDALGCAISVPSAATVSFSDTAGEGPMQMHQGAITLTGPTDAATLQGQIKKISFELDRNLSIEHGPGVLTPIYLLERRRLVRVKIQAMFSGPNVYQLTHFGANAGTSLSAVLGTGSAVALFTAQASPARTLQLTVSNFTYQDAQPMYDPKGETALIDIECVGYRSGATLPLTVVAVNNDSTSYTA